jgi:hypothetical protein
VPRLWILLAAAVHALAQNPYSTLPRNYSLEFENEFVRVSRVRFSPGDRLPVHSHPPVPTVYVYLTDGGRVRFIHKTPSFTLERLGVKAGSVRFNRNARVETHEVEYLGEAACEYLRVELKTAPAPPHRDARLNGDGDFPWEDAQVRIGCVYGLPPRPARRAILVDIRQRSFRWFDPGSASSPALPTHPDWYIILELKGQAS